MPQHFKNDAEELAAMKRSRLLITIVLIVIAITIAFISYKYFVHSATRL